MYQAFPDLSLNCGQIGANPQWYASQLAYSLLPFGNLDALKFMLMSETGAISGAT